MVFINLTMLFKGIKILKCVGCNKKCHLYCYGFTISMEK